MNFIKHIISSLILNYLKTKLYLHYKFAPYLPNNFLLKKLKQTFNENNVIFYYLSKEKKRGLMIDVGAMNGGAFYPFMLHNYIIHTFEPDPDLRKRIILEKYAKKRNVFLHHFAVSDTDDQEMDFYTSKESAGISSLRPFTPDHVFSAKVKTITLRKFIKENKIQSVNYLKIDTEGFDLFVLKGFPWELICPDILLCEFEDKKTIPLGYTFEDMGNFLLEKNYEVYFTEWNPIVQYGIKHEFKHIKKFPGKLDDQAGWGNFIAFRKELTDFKRIIEFLIKS